MFCIEHRKQNNLCIECILTEIAHFASLPSAKIQLNRNAALRCSIIMIPVLQIKFSFLQSCICWRAIKYLCCRGIVAGLSVIWMVTQFSPNAWLIIGGCIWLLFTLLFTRLFNSNLDFAEPQNILSAH